MHAEALNWLKGQVRADATLLGRHGIDIGGRNVNGSIQTIFRPASWMALDHEEGRGVDIVADLRGYQPFRTWGLVACTEVAEHLEKDDLVLLIQTLWRCCSHDGVVLFTAATDPRKPHSAVGSPVVPAGEPYNNVNVEELSHLAHCYFQQAKVEVDRKHGDVYMRASRPRATPLKVN